MKRKYNLNLTPQILREPEEKAGERRNFSNLRFADPAGFCGRAPDTLKRERETREILELFRVFRNVSRVSRSLPAFLN
jgi:hypothetical protein